MMIQNKELIDRFLRYVRIDTQSREDAGTVPSTEKQRDLADLLAKELEEMGIAVDYDRENCYVYAFLPEAGTVSETASESAASAPEALHSSIGFIAHMDTSPSVSGANVRPRIIESYDGHDPILKTEDFPELLSHIGEDLIATDGITLLGADNKAGVAEIMSMCSYYASHPDVPHRGIAVCFTPDEEVGGGTARFDKDRFHASEGYTVDGGKLGILEYECFNAAAATVSIDGVSVHPGSAKDCMINACGLAVDFASRFPKAETPEHTEGYEGFYHLDFLSGDVEHTTMKYIIRDHSKETFEKRKKYFLEQAEAVNKEYGGSYVSVDMHDQYYNMGDMLGDHMYLIEDALSILRDLGADAKTEPIRGGTDGALLTYMGIPCPNLCTGGYNFHSRFEYASIQEMEKVVLLLIQLAKEK